MKRPIYLDYMSTTPVDPRVIEKMIPYLGPSGHFGNPASVTHVYGQEALQAVEHAREQIAYAIGATVQDIVFTSGATEANNLAILGASLFYQRKGRHIVTMSTEHKSVLDSFHYLEQQGFEVSYLAPDAQGLLEVNTLMNALREDTILVSIMHVNNEIGVIQDIGAIGDILRGRGIVFHVDAAQSAGKLALNMQELAVDLMSFSAHKNYGPKGVGALFVRHKPRIRLQAQSYGGGHEGGLRSGTLPTHQIVGMGEAFALAEEARIPEQKRILGYRQHVWDNIKDLPRLRLNGDDEQRIAGNLNFSIEGIDGESLLATLSPLAVSSTSACTSASVQPSYVLRALGVPEHLAKSSIRLSIGRFTTEEDIEETISVMRHGIKKLLSLEVEK